MNPHAEFIAWAEAQEAAGKRDAMGGSFTAWQVSIVDGEGRAVRDEHGRQVFESQAACKARYQHAAMPRAHAVGENLELFA